MITKKQIQEIIAKNSENGIWINPDELIVAIKECCKINHKSEVKKLNLHSVSNCKYKDKYEKCIDVIKRFDAGIIGMYDL